MKTERYSSCAFYPCRVSLINTQFDTQLRDPCNMIRKCFCEVLRSSRLFSQSVSRWTWWVEVPTVSISAKKLWQLNQNENSSSELTTNTANELLQRWCWTLKMVFNALVCNYNFQIHVLIPFIFVRLIHQNPITDEYSVAQSIMAQRFLLFGFCLLSFSR